MLAKKLVDAKGKRLHSHDAAPVSVRSVEVALSALSVLPNPFREPLIGDAFSAEKHFLG
jgi:hypothetical protein